MVSGSVDSRRVIPNGPYLLALRISRGWTREQLAQITGYCVGTHAKLEASKPVFLSTLSVVAVTFEVPVQDLMLDEPLPLKVPPSDSMTAYEVLHDMRRLFDEHEQAIRGLIDQFLSSHDGRDEK